MFWDHHPRKSQWLPRVRLDTHMGVVGRVKGCDLHIISAPSLAIHGSINTDREVLLHITRPLNISHSWILGQQWTYHFYQFYWWKNLGHKLHISNPCPCSPCYPMLYCEPFIIARHPRAHSSTVILTASPYRMSVFFQVVSLHFLKSSVHLSIKGKKNSTLEFCSKRAKNTKGWL